jgi:hypothetical protein
MPAMVRWHGTVRAGSHSSELVATYDIFTTSKAYAQQVVISSSPCTDWL